MHDCNVPFDLRASFIPQNVVTTHIPIAIFGNKRKKLKERRTPKGRSHTALLPTSFNYFGNEQSEYIPTGKIATQWNHNTELLISANRSIAKTSLIPRWTKRYTLGRDFLRCRCTFSVNHLFSQTIYTNIHTFTFTSHRFNAVQCFCTCIVLQTLSLLRIALVDLFISSYKTYFVCVETFIGWL